MDRQYSWKRTEDIEIDLADLLKKLCRKWKQTAACAIACAVVLGGYGYLKGRNETRTDTFDTARDSELTEEEQQAVDQAVRLNHEIRGLEMYLNNSVLMQTDPYHRSRFIMLYRVDHVKRQELQAVTESYLNFLVNGAAADALRKNDTWQKMDKSCLAELITAYQKTYSFPYQAVLDEAAVSSMLAEAFFYVEITGENAKSAEKLARDIQDVLEEYSEDVKENAGSHRLMPISSAQSMTADSGLLTQQNDKRNLLSSNQASLRTMTDSFNEQQMIVYEEEAGEENRQKESSEPEGNSDDKAESEAKFSQGIKYIFLGLAGGVFVYCGIFSCWYIFSDKLKSTEEIKRLYAFPFYGGILLKSTNGRKDAAAAAQDISECGQVQVLNRIRLACKKQGFTKLCVTSAFAYSEREKKCLTSMAQELKQWAIDMAVIENVTSDTAVWDSIAETGNVLVVCRLGETTHRMIEDEMNFYTENNIGVMGAVAFSKYV